MKALFVHDHKFFVNSYGDVYSSGKLPYSVWERYLKHFSELVVVARSQPLSVGDCKKLNISSGKKVSFVFLPDLASPVSMLLHRKRVKENLKLLIDSVDAVIARSSLLGNLAAAAAEKMKKPWALEVVGCAWDAYWNYGNIKGKLLAPIAFCLSRKLVGRAPYSLYVTKEFLQKRYPCSGITSAVSNVELPELSSSVVDLRLQKAVGCREPVVFGFIGSLESKYKGVQTAFSAFKMIKDQLPQFEFQIVGNGDPAPWIHLAKSFDLSGNVKFIGTLPAGEDVFKWLDGVDVYLQPSFTEGLPRSLVEALSRGCPAIGSTAGGIPELLGSDVLHKPGDVKHLAHLILRSMDIEWCRQQTHRNFKTAQLYTNDILNARRDKFWQTFAAYARQVRL